MDRTPYRFEPVTPRTAGDLERFSRAHGKFRYCSCQRWRLSSAQYRDAGRDGRVASLHAAARSCAARCRDWPPASASRPAL